MKYDNISTHLGLVLPKGSLEQSSCGSKGARDAARLKHLLNLPLHYPNGTASASVPALFSAITDTND